MKPMKFGVGQSVRRVEDQRFVTGAGRYTADFAPAGVLHAVVLRSPHAHARFAIRDLAAAQACPGVAAILTAADTADLGDLPCLATAPNADGSAMALPPYPILARDIVRHVGDAIAMIVAQTEAQAILAAEAVVIDYEPLPVVIGSREALAPDAPRVWPHFGGNLAYDAAMGDKAAVDAIFAQAARVVSLDLVNNRVVCNYLEPRAAIGEVDAATGRMTLTLGSQGVHSQQRIIAACLRIAPEQLRVVTPDVGGGFGTKGFVYREYPLVLLAAKLTGAPVKWVCERTEHFLADAQGRDNLTTAEMALDGEGRFLAMRVDILANLGAYLSQYAPYIPWLGATMATGCYDIPALYARCRGVYTHTQPVDAYRGAGRPEAAYALERLVDQCARAAGIAPDAIRAKNFITPAQMPYHTQTDRTYDVGEFEAAMRVALEQADYAGFATRAAASSAQGKARGIGFASYIECTAWGSGETGSVSLDADGDFTVIVGTQSNGQGHATAYAQVVAQYLDVPPERVRVVQGDSDRVKTGGGTGGSRSIPVGAAMLTRASSTLADRVKALAADALEAALADLEIVDGAVRIAGTDRAISYQEIARLPQATREALTAIDTFTPPQPTYPNGTHVCELEVDPETGRVDILAYTICDDFGMTLNPLLLEGQVHGGIAQGIGQALMERTLFGDDGQLITASFMDYAMPRATDVPNFHFETRNVPSTTNPLGLKGAGEAGSIGACPAVMNALNDALHRAYGIAHIDMPATPLAIHQAIARG